jgi:hypothetical protein
LPCARRRNLRAVSVSLLTLAELEAHRRMIIPAGHDAALLAALADRLQAIHDALPAARNRDPMLDHRVPRDVATEIYGVIEAILVDEVRPAVEYLEAASRVTAEELRERFDAERR